MPSASTDDRYWTTLHALEHRGSRPYDQQDSSTLYMPNSSLVCTFCPTLASVFAPLVLSAHVDAPVPQAGDRDEGGRRGGALPAVPVGDGDTTAEGGGAGAVRGRP